MSQKEGDTSKWGKRYTDEYLEERRHQVVSLAKLGCSDKEIADVVQIGEDTLKNRMRDAIDEGRSNMRASLRKAQIEAAIVEKNPTMLIWLGKCYLGQREPKKEIEHSGGVTVEKVVFYDESKVVDINTG